MDNFDKKNGLWQTYPTLVIQWFYGRPDNTNLYYRKMIQGMLNILYILSEKSREVVEPPPPW